MPNPKVPHNRDRPSNLEKRPEDWTTGDERMTDAQASYLKTLSEEAKEPFDESLSKAEASKRIDALKAKTGRGNIKTDGAHAHPHHGALRPPS